MPCLALALASYTQQLRTSTKPCCANARLEVGSGSSQGMQGLVVCDGSKRGSYCPVSCLLRSDRLCYVMQSLAIHV